MADIDITASLSDLATGGLGTLVGALQNLGVVGIGAGAAVTAALAGVAVGAFALGQSFDGMYDRIRAGTGKTGEALTGLQNDLKAVMKEVPADGGDIADAMVTIEQRTGLTGEALQRLTTEVLRFSNLTGTNATQDVVGLTQVFGNWNIAAEDQVTTMDFLFRATQQTGVGANQLLAQLTQFGPTLRQLGFSFNESTALLSMFEREGLNTGPIMMGLRTSIAKLTEDGTPAKEALQRIFDEIKNAQDPTAATTKAIEVFGARAGVQLAEAIRAGKFEVGELTKALEDGTDTIDQATADTQDAAEAWKMFSNTIMVALDPIGSAVFNFANTVTQAAIPAMSGWVDALGPIQQGLGDLFGLLSTGDPEERIKFFNDLSTIIGPEMAERVALVTSGIIGLFAAFNGDPEGLNRIKNALDGLFGAGTGERVAATIDSIVQGFQGFMANAQAIGSMVMDFLAPAFSRVVEAVGEIKPRFDDLLTAVGPLVDSFGPLVSAMQPVAAFIGAEIVVAVDLLINLFASAIPAAIDIVKITIQTLTGVFQGLAAVIGNSVEFVSDLLHGNWAAAWGDAGNIVSGFGQVFGSILGGLAKVAAVALGAVLEAVINGLADITGTAGIKAGEITDAIMTALNVDWSGLITGWITSFTDQFSRFKGAVEDKLKGLRDMLPHSPAKEGPLAEPVNWGYLFADMPQYAAEAVIQTYNVLSVLAAGLPALVGSRSSGGGAGVAAAAVAGTGTGDPIHTMTDFSEYVRSHTNASKLPVANMNQNDNFWHNVGPTPSGGDFWDAINASLNGQPYPGTGNFNYQLGDIHVTVAADPEGKVSMPAFVDATQDVASQVLANVIASLRGGAVGRSLA